MIQKLKKLLGKNAVLFPLLALVAIGAGFASVSALTNNSYPTGADCKGTCVALTPDGMKPNELAIKAGDFVQFNSADGKKHNLSLGEGEGGTEGHGHGPHAGKHEHSGQLSSGDIAPDEAWRVQFNEVGTYQLHDHYNPKLNILVVVYRTE